MAFARSGRRRKLRTLEPRRDFMNRRLVLIAIAGLAALSASAGAQDSAPYPSKPIRVIVPSTTRWPDAVHCATWRQMLRSMLSIVVLVLRSIDRPNLASRRLPNDPGETLILDGPPNPCRKGVS